ncbi:50S ribosomal protein L24 [Caldivirga sp. UBA161]|uniref:50S ribosomal protein L24 n=1 Tax=Caldivirga sp. UBA161 TaxID=1915569 RepID=UPI0025BEE656|nr:50S ribosomal protein L24 [Caldivirga sp. UBA161]
MPVLTSSSQPRKQHKALAKAPWHARRKLLTAPLSKDLQRQLGIRRIPVRVGDTVLIMRGDFKGTRGKVTRVDYRRVRIYVDSASFKKPSGEALYYPIHPSKVIIVELDQSDKARVTAIERIRKAREAKAGGREVITPQQGGQS